MTAPQPIPLTAAELSRRTAKRAANHKAWSELLDVLAEDAFDGRPLDQVAKQCLGRALFMARVCRCPWLDERSQREIANLLGCTESNVSQRVKEMREEFERNGTFRPRRLRPSCRPTNPGYDQNQKL